MATANSNGGKRPTDGLSGADKVTVVLLAMGKPLSDRIIRQFEDREIRTLARSATELPPIELDIIERLVSDLTTQLESASAIEGSSSGARTLLSGVVPVEEVGEIMGELAGEPPTQIWKKLGGIAEEKLANFISTEQPQVAAYVISKLTPEKSSLIMEKLDADLRSELSLRLVAMKPISDVAVKLLAERLGSDLFGEVAKAGEQNNHALLGSILNQLDQTKTKAIIERLATDLPEDARKVRKYMFGFQDVARLALEDRARLFDEVPTERTILALRECDAELAAKVLDALAPRARRMVDSELAMQIKVPRKSVTEAQQSIASMALNLADRSVISLPSDEQPPGEQA